jgi:hypothetical protein
MIAVVLAIFIESTETSRQRSKHNARVGNYGVLTTHLKRLKSVDIARKSVDIARKSVDIARTIKIDMYKYRLFQT